MSGRTNMAPLAQLRRVDEALWHQVASNPHDRTGFACKQALAASLLGDQDLARALIRDGFMALASAGDWPDLTANVEIGISEADATAIVLSSMRLGSPEPEKPTGTPAIDLDALTNNQRDNLSELVHQQASELASNAINAGEEIEWLIVNGWTRDDICSRLCEMVVPEEGA